MRSGIYQITNRQTGHSYVGSAVSLVARRTEHFSGLKRGRHHNQRLQRAWAKYGAEAFEFKVLLRCTVEDLIFYEQRCLDGLNPEYNLAPVAGSSLGYRHTTETKAKLRVLRYAQVDAKNADELRDMKAAFSLGRGKSNHVGL